GNTDPSEAVRTWTVDTVAPDTAIGSGPSGPTASRNASFGFSSEAGATFECRLDDGAWEACESPRALTELAQGLHTFRVRAVDAAGNTDPSEATRTWTVDTEAPETTLGGGPDGVVAAKSASLSFGSSEGGSAFECRVDGGGWEPCTSPRALTNLAEGGHTFRVRATDAAGNTDPTEATRSWTVDTVAPDTTIASGPAGPTASTSATIAFSSSEAGSSFECRLDAGGWDSCSSPRTLTGLAQGAHTLRVRAIDAAGNVDATEAERGWTVDTVEPDTTIESAPDATTPSNRAELGFGSSEDGASFECRVGNGAWESCAAPLVLSGLANGQHRFQVRARDAAGNTDSSPAGHEWTVDAEPPETSITGGPAGTVRSSSATFSFVAEAGATFECSLDAGAWRTCAAPHRIAGLAFARHTFAVRAVDSLGNADPTPATRTWTAERTPVIAEPPPGEAPEPPAEPAGPSPKLIQGRLAEDVAAGARALRKLGARRLVKRRGAIIRGLRALTPGTFSAKLTMRRGGRTVLVAKGAARARAAGPVALHFRLTRTGRTVLAAERRPRLRLSVEFRDATGRRTLRVASLHV
ncbi:MAG: hypothetical protein JW895_17445, partial [Thermoleophilaceae bacterium]|nr:hypothetical protein [Thermoleophilaceae bacterium]